MDIPNVYPTKLFFRFAVVVPASGRHTATVIFLHGVCDTFDYTPLFADKESHIKFIYPRAPVIPITIEIPLTDFVKPAGKYTSQYVWNIILYIMFYRSI